MPYKRHPKKPMKKRTYRRKPRISRPINALATVHKCEMTYAEQFAIDAVADITSTYVFRANSLYDPNVTGTGHQPMGFDQMCEFYQKFTVTASSIELHVVYPSASQPNPALWGVIVSTDAGAPTGLAVTDILEQKFSTRIRSAGTISNEQTLTNVERKKFSLRKFFGGKVQPCDPSYQCTASADATNLAYYNVYCCSTVPLENPGSINFIAKIRYYVTCTDPIMLTQS